MVECYECGYELSEEDVEYNCPFCDEADLDEGFIRCEICGTLMTPSEDLWECECCHNECIKNSPQIEMTMIIKTMTMKNVIMMRNTVKMICLTSTGVGLVNIMDKS